MGALCSFEADRLYGRQLKIVRSYLKDEIYGQAEAVATNILKMAGLKVPIVALILSEGGSGGEVRKCGWVFGIYASY